MTEKQRNNTSKLLSLVLRHQPETIGITLDEHGWTDVANLIAQLNAHGHAITSAELDEVVTMNGKQRFAVNEAGTQIRASQGHTLEVELNLVSAVPPEYLYHGTVAKFIDSIRSEGLRKMSRRHVHLSADHETAENVAMRRGKPIILTINSGQMHRDGHVFYLSENGVWLTNGVDAGYIA